MTLPIGQKINSSQMAYIIDQCLEAVEKSKLGSIYLKDEKGNTKLTQDGVPICISVNISAFLTVLQCYFPKNINQEINIEKKE